MSHTSSVPNVRFDTTACFAGQATQILPNKRGWLRLPYTPPVVFNTPLPNAASATVSQFCRPASKSPMKQQEFSTVPINSCYHRQSTNQDPTSITCRSPLISGSHRWDHSTRYCQTSRLMEGDLTPETAMEIETTTCYPCSNTSGQIQMPSAKSYLYSLVDFPSRLTTRSGGVLPLDHSGRILMPIARFHS